MLFVRKSWDVPTTEHSGASLKPELQLLYGPTNHHSGCILVRGGLNSHLDTTYISLRKSFSGRLSISVWPVGLFIMGFLDLQLI